MLTKPYALKLSPVFKDYIWGGTRLMTEFNMDCPLDIAAEAWVFSTHADGPSIVQNGELAGKTFNEALDAFGREAWGENCEKFENFPMLIKFIDALNDLSVQVHPSDEYALDVEGEYGKTEMWVVLDADPGSCLCYGFSHEISKEEFKERLNNGTLMEVLNRVPVNKGDVFFIDAGTLHAIGKGLLIAEIQQNSNSTYRVFDYNRKDTNGNPRPLHIEKALDVTNTCPPAIKPGAAGQTEKLDGGTETLLGTCRYFTVYSYDVDSKITLNANKTSFLSLTFTSGEGVLRFKNGTINFSKGDSFFVPAGEGEFTVEGGCQVLVSRV